MKISACNCSPVIPLYNNSLPVELYPFCVNTLPKISWVEPLFINAVQSP